VTGNNEHGAAVQPIGLEALGKPGTLHCVVPPVGSIVCLVLFESTVSNLLQLRNEVTPVKEPVGKCLFSYRVIFNID